MTEFTNLKDYRDFIRTKPTWFLREGLEIIEPMKDKKRMQYKAIINRELNYREALKR